jgi:hypothetical protein
VALRLFVACFSVSATVWLPSNFGLLVGLPVLLSSVLGCSFWIPCGHRLPGPSRGQVNSETRMSVQSFSYFLVGRHRLPYIFNRARVSLQSQDTM